MKKSYEDILEFYKIQNYLADHSYLVKTKEKFIDIKRFDKKDLLEKEFLLMQDLIDFYKYDDGFDIQEIKNLDRIKESLKILGSYLELEDLHILNINLALYRKSKSRAKNVRDKYKRIWDIFSLDMPSLKECETLINEIIDENGDIKDTASLTLRDIKKQKQIINENIKDKVDNIFSDPKYANAVSEKIMTIRNDRYVINVKADFKSLIKGIEHDKSSSKNSIYIEPLSIVSLNNKLREYEAREREEIRKILIKITEYLRARKDDIFYANDILENIDFLNAKVVYSIENSCNIPKIISKGGLSLVKAKHPLIDKEKVVPISFNLDEENKIMLITGPNTGGKTVTLKVAGLLSIMALCGIPIPADEKSEIPLFDLILADIGDEQSIEQNLSSFSSHVSSISNILDKVTNRSLVLLDELGSGTDPTEGSAFAMSIIDYLNEKKCYSIISTHYSEVKAHAYNNEGIKTSSMEFDIKSLMPTYRLIEGIPGESNALIIAKKYGISDEIIENAKSYISEDNKKVEKMLLSIKEKNEELEKLNEEVLVLKEELKQEKEMFTNKLAELEKEKTKILEESLLNADEYLKNIQAKAKALIDKINTEEKNKQDVKDAQRSINMLYNSIIEDKKKVKEQKKENTKEFNFEIGEEVLVKSLNQNAKILKLIPNKASLQVQAGILKLVIPITDAVKILKKNKRAKGSVSFSRGVSKTQIDVRGKVASDAIHEIEAFLDKSVLSGFTHVYIVHGKGTMVLRQKIREYLSCSMYVLEFKDAEQNEGGHGCTVVTLK